MMVHILVFDPDSAFVIYVSSLAYPCCCRSLSSIHPHIYIMPATGLATSVVGALRRGQARCDPARPPRSPKRRHFSRHSGRKSETCLKLEWK